MSDTVQKARALLKEVQTERGYENLPVSINRQIHINEALCRAIKQHEATKQEYSDFQQKVSDAIAADVDKQISAKVLPQFRTNSVRFIIPAPKPDPLVEVMKQAGWADAVIESCAPSLRAALDARGLEIKEKEQ
jgi:hypothetical protein